MFYFMCLRVLPACVPVGLVHEVPRRSEEGVGFVSGVTDSC